MSAKNIRRAVISIAMALILGCSSFAGLVAGAVEFDSSLTTDGTFLTSYTRTELAPGITESVISTNNAEGSFQVTGFMLEVDMNEPTAGITTSYKNYDPSAGWGMQSVRDQAFAAEDVLGVDVVAGVNGDFYNMGNGKPTGTFVLNGVEYTNNPGWNYFAILDDGTPIIGSGELDTSNVKHCIGGPYVLIKDGVICADSEENYSVTRNPRTAIGIKADGTVMFFVSDGRHAPVSEGTSYRELAEVMFALGCVDALNIDGGGSSTYVSKEYDSDNLTCKSNPSDGCERTVSTAMLVYTTAEAYNDAPVEVVKDSASEGHKYVYDNGNVSCKECNEAFDAKNCSGLAENAENGKIMYLLSGKPKKGWFALGQSVYYFDSNGNAVTGSKKIGKYTYTFGDDGVLTKGAVVKNGKYYNYYIADILQRGWNFYDGYWHYVDVVGTTGLGGFPSWAIATGYYPTTRRESELSLYFTFDSNGQLIKGAWADMEEGLAYYWGYNERLYGMHEIDGDTYYFGHDTYAVTGWQYIDNAIYYFYEDYIMAKDVQTVDDVEYNFGEDGKLQLKNESFELDGKYYYFDNDGNIAENHIADHAAEVQTVEGKAPTCTETGLSEGLVCTVCDVVIKEQTQVEATGHDYVSAVTKEATCTENGVTTFTCSDCGDSYEEAIEATGHTAGEKEVVKEPAVEVPGLEQVKCTVCGEVLEETEIPALEKPSEEPTTEEPSTEEPSTEEPSSEEPSSEEPSSEEPSSEEPSSEEPSSEEPSTNDTYKSGDLNNDGIITAADARLALRLSAKLDVSEDEKILKAADVNSDGKITAADARLILRAAAKIEELS